LDESAKSYLSDKDPVLAPKGIASGGAKGWKSDNSRGGGDSKGGSSGSSGGLNRFSALAVSSSPVQERHGASELDSSSESVPSRPSSSSGSSAPKSVKSQEKLTSETENILEEYYHINDVSEAVECVREMEAPEDFMAEFVNLTINSSLEGNKNPSMVSKLFIELHKQQLLSEDSLADGLHMVLELLPEFVIDLPKSPEQLAGMLTKLISQQVFSLEFLGQELVSLANSGIAEKILVPVLVGLAADVGAKTARAIYQDSGLEIVRCMSGKEKEAKEARLQAVIESHPELARILNSVNASDFNREDLKEVVNSSPSGSAGAEAILAWIKSNVPSDCTNDEEFIRTLTAAVLDKACCYLQSVDTKDIPPPEVIKQEITLLKDLTPVLKQFLPEDDTTTQVYCLNEVQQFCFTSNFPRGLIERLFNYLYEENVVFEDAFFDWEKDQTTPGKREALSQVNEFIRWLAADEGEEGQSEGRNSNPISPRGEE